MAGTLAIKSETTAQAWIAKCEQLNERAYNLNQRVGQILAMIDADSEGDIVVALVQAANSMLKFAEEIMNAMKAIADKISGLIDSIKNIVTDTVKKIREIISGN